MSHVEIECGCGTGKRIHTRSRQMEQSRPQGHAIVVQA
jgi:hypothetical protein